MTSENKCLTCELVQRRDEGNAPLWDSIYRTQYWDVVHSYNTSLYGWLVLVTRRHIAAIEEMSEEEAIELGKLLRKVSQILKTVTGCAKTYVIQFAENVEHPHVHFHVVPRMSDLPADHRGKNIFNYLGVDEADRITEDDMNKIAKEVQLHLQDFS